MLKRALLQILHLAFGHNVSAKLPAGDEMLLLCSCGRCERRLRGLGELSA